MDERTKRNALVVGAIVLALLSIGAGALIALSDDETSRRATPSSTPTPTDASRAGTDRALRAVRDADRVRTPSLEDGHHFVYRDEDAVFRSDSG